MKEQLTTGSVWQHHSGRKYTVLALTNKAHPSEKYPETVCYCDENSVKWSKPIDRFLGSMTYIGEQSEEYFAKLLLAAAMRRRDATPLDKDRRKTATWYDYDNVIDILKDTVTRLTTQEATGA